MTFDEIRRGELRKGLLDRIALTGKSSGLQFSRAMKMAIEAIHKVQYSVSPACMAVHVSTEQLVRVCVCTSPPLELASGIFRLFPVMYSELVFF